MKSIRKILGGLAIIGGFIALSGFIQAQVTTSPVQSILGGAGLVDNQPDSIVRVVADSQGLSLVPSDQIPKFGTFWIVYGRQPAVPLPFLPSEYDPASTPVFSLGPNGEFLVDFSGGAVPQPNRRQAMLGISTASLVQGQVNSLLGLIDQVQESQMNVELDSLFPGDGGGGTNTYFASSYPPVNYGTNLWIANFGLSSSNAVGIVSNTTADISYEIQYVNDLTATQWLSGGFIFGSELTNWTAMSMTNALSYTNNLFLRIRSWASSDGSGLPDWWELQYFGTTGIDPYGNPMGDGWNNLQKFQNGMNPNVFYTPPAPQGVTAAYNAANGTALVNWLPSPGPVTGYTITDVYGHSTNASANATSVYADASNLSFFNLGYDGPNVYQGYSVQANYSGGNSAWSDTAWLGYTAAVPPISLIPAAKGSACLAIAPSALPANTTAIRLTRVDQWAASHYGINIFTNFDIPLSAFANGLYSIPSAWLVHPVDAYGKAYYNWWGETLNTNDSQNSRAILLSQGFNLNSTNGWMVPPYFDGRVQMKQNLVFQLRSAQVDTPFQFDDIYTYNTTTVTFPANFAYAGFYDFNSGAFNALLPFVNNYTYRNFVFKQSDLSSSGLLNSVTNYLTTFDFGLTEPAPYWFQLPTTTTNLTPIPSLLDTNNTRWLGVGLTCFADFGDFGYEYDNFYEIGMYYNSANGTFVMDSGIQNLYGLTFLSTEAVHSSSQMVTLYPGNGANSSWMYSEVAQPQFQTVEYDFWSSSPVPGMTSFSTNETSDLIIAPVGNSINVYGYAKLAVTNGFPGVYAYLGQYFTNAYEIDTNSNVTTNSTGVLSPYGQFFATEPGLAGCCKTG